MSTILIVDDSDITRDILRNILVCANYEVIGEAADGQEALDEYKRLNPDLVIMDIIMANVDGLQALKMIREYHPEACVVICSAMGDHEKVIEAIKAGAKEFIIKPFMVEDVLKAVSKSIGC